MDVSLEVFVTVVEKGNFTRAAEELRMTQPAVSQYIQALERTVGAKLLERTNKYVRLNQAGEIVFHHAKDILGMYTRMQTLVDDLLHRASGDLSISASYTFGEYVLPHLLAYMHEVYPLIRPRINIGNTTEVAEAILNHQADIGIVEGEYYHENLHIEAFAEDEMFVIVPNEERYAGRGEISLSELGKETWIVRESGSGTRRAAEHMFTSRHFQPDNKMEFGSTQLIKESVEAGLGVTLLSHWAVRKEISLGTLIMLKPDGEPVRRHFSLITQATPYHTKAAEIFLDLLRMNKAFPVSYV
ncbi:DNA-binding transcriptional regulator, LysR family [Paenibacillus uliginis N3/975]|uniref:DNA-binding transcriptional regulator, LysR family n=1 Tax=Paenibacillus uliginis N3/975 TaxID=1313296 RepID=A0A1X7G7N8_9BACL|nr:LysR family transcriptional regulator [Paenibacillus uliginis]SMF65438.1 DNA-binding transcriptional regulator, LysR family [Paenibacillus uliginis N3/975]